jgi:hypothetical protein
VLGPILFLLYTADLVRFIADPDLLVHLYADDTQTYGASSSSSVSKLQLRMSVSVCIDDVVDWMASNRLQMNTAKTEVLWCLSARRQHQLPTEPVRVGRDNVIPAASVRDLGIFIDSDVSMRTHVSRTVSACFGILRHLRSLRRYVTESVFQSLVASLILTKLDYGNATLAGVPAHQIHRLQAVMNAAARLIFHASRHDHITPAAPPPALAACTRANHVQAVSADISLPPRSGTGIPVCRSCSSCCRVIETASPLSICCITDRPAVLPQFCR